jgi:ubiquinone/menaquinone biosynthesis C-methylase UbiE
MPKDLFSDQSKTYAKYRPTYPQELFDYIFQFVERKEKVWDCATGNGQAANILADHFGKVEASDISEAQISHAVKKGNIEYHICPAEHTPFADNSFDLITIATAYHWLNWKEFYREALRVGKPDSVVAVWSYNLIVSGDERINSLIHHFYKNITGPYWDPERSHLDASYSTVEFDFDPLPSKDFEIRVNWTKQEFLGYLRSWSAVQNYINQHHTSPLDLIKHDLDQIWNDDIKKLFQFPLFLKIGRIPGCVTTRNF